MRRFGDELPPCFGTYKESWCPDMTCCPVIPQCEIVKEQIRYAIMEMKENFG